MKTRVFKRGSVEKPEKTGVLTSTHKHTEAYYTQRDTHRKTHNTHKHTHEPVSFLAKLSRQNVYPCPWLREMEYWI